MSTKDAAKKVLKLYEANAALLNAIEERGAHMCAESKAILAAMPDAKKAVETLMRRFP